MTAAPLDVDATLDSRPTWRERLAHRLNQAQFTIYTVLIIFLLALGVLWPRVVVVVPPGHLGVMYRTVYGGTTTDRIWSEGLHIIPPWDRLTVYDVRLQQRKLDFKVLSDEGLTLGVNVVVRYHPYKEMLGYLQKEIGPDYFESLIQPEIESHIRRTFGGRPAHEVYASVRDVLQEVGQFPLIGKMEKSATGMVSHPYVYVQEIKLTQIDLPKIVENAIVEKYHQEQLMLAYKYKLEREEKEADRKRTEAAGIRDFNLIAGKVSADMLRWRSIDAALELAKSNNSKVIVLGGGQSNLAMQLNLGDVASGSAAAEPHDKKEPAAPLTTPAPPAPQVKAPEPKKPAPEPHPPARRTEAGKAPGPPT